MGQRYLHPRGLRRADAVLPLPNTTFRRAHRVFGITPSQAEHGFAALGRSATRAGREPFSRGHPRGDHLRWGQAYEDVTRWTHSLSSRPGSSGELPGAPQTSSRARAHIKKGNEGKEEHKKANEAERKNHKLEADLTLHSEKAKRDKMNMDIAIAAAEQAAANEKTTCHYRKWCCG